MPVDVPKVLGKHVVIVIYHDENFHHNLFAVRSVTGVLYLISKTHVDWYSKRQSTVNTSACGSECYSACTCVEQIIYLRITLRCLGAPLYERSYMLGHH